MRGLAGIQTFYRLPFGTNFGNVRRVYLFRVLPVWLRSKRCRRQRVI